MARPRKTLTDEQTAQVQKLAAVMTQEQIADFMGISDRTLRRRMREDENVLSAYARGRAQAIATVAASLLKQAQSGELRAMEFYLKTQAGWKETSRHEIVQPEDVKALSDDELAAIAEGRTP